MANKAYIVANKQQEREVLDKFERDGIVWVAGIEKPTEWIPSQLEGAFTAGFPYALVIDNKGRVSWSNIRNLTNHKIVYDGRKEEQMKISKEVYDALVEWKNNLVSSKRIYADDVTDLYSENVIRHWWQGDGGGTDANNRLIAIIRWVNGEDVFEVEKSKKWVVRSKEPQGSVDGEPLYIWFVDELTLETETEATMPPYIRRFDTKEEAQEWANSHQEVVEVGE